MNPGTVFQRLKTLVGEWQGTTQTGRILKVSYQLVANDTVLVETWTLAPERLALTLYHMDGSNLMATHYCPLGNQPRLRLQPDHSEQKFVFSFFDATNMQHPDEAHQHQFDIELLTPESFARSETYVENRESETDTVVYSRTA